MSLTAQEVRQRVISQMKSQKPKGQFNESMFPSSQVCSFSHNSRIINLNTYYSILPPAAGGAAGGAPAGGGPASRRHSITNDEQEGGAGRPLETFVAEALLREAIRTNMTCAISMEPVEHRGFVVTNCFHIFQREALEQWAESHTNCPVCRAALVYRPVNVTLPQ